MHEPEAKYWLFFPQKYNFEDFAHFILTMKPFPTFPCTFSSLDMQRNIQITDFHMIASEWLLILFAQVADKWIVCPTG